MSLACLFTVGVPIPLKTWYAAEISSCYILAGDPVVNLPLMLLGCKVVLSKV